MTVPSPPHLDETDEAPLPAACPDCGARVTLTHHATQFQEDLPPVRPVVRAFHISGCRSAESRRCFRERFELTITCGGLVHAIRRAARQAEPTYAALAEQIRGRPVVTSDETGWKVDARLS